MRRFLSLFILANLLMLLVGCRSTRYISSPESGFTHATMLRLRGFNENRKALLRENGMTMREFVALSTDSAWSLAEGDKVRLANFRNSLPWPDSTTLLQKVVSLSDAPKYEENREGGCVGGFVSVAADTKELNTMFEIYYGLRLDYSGTRVRPDGEGYAVIRFYSNYTDSLYIPFCKELGGPQPNMWPCTGGGFTSSSLGTGGIPEYVFPNYYKPREGAEIYHVDTYGKETLSSVFRDGRWQKVGSF